MIFFNDRHSLFNSPKYRFLNNTPFLSDNIFYLTLGGSRSYGTNLPDSDYDLRGGYLENPRSLFALEQQKEEFVETETDTTLYSLRKLAKLLASCNPNVIEMLGTRDEDVVYMNGIGKALRDNYRLFLSKRAFYTFSGYATQQLRRLQNALARDQYTQPEKEKHILKSISVDILTSGEPFNAYMLDPEQANKNESQFNISLEVLPSNSDDFETEIFIDGTMKHLPLREYTKLNSKLANTIKNYGLLTQRNKKKDTAHLNKHAMHLIRLYYMGIDILKNQEIVTYREKEHDLLMSIRHGEMPFEKIFAMQEKLEKEMDEARIFSTLPEHVDSEKIDDLLMKFYSKAFSINLRPPEERIYYDGLTTLKFNFDLDAVDADGLTTDELLAPMREYAQHSGISEPEYGLFTLPTDRDSFCIMTKWLIRYVKKHPKYPYYFKSIISTLNDEVENCLPDLKEM